MSQWRLHVDAAMENWLPAELTNPINLHQAMRYSVFNGGKRIRPILAYATGESFGAIIKNIDVPASAIELIHAYSLIHDDLPAMDDDDLRRGRPTCHIAHGEAMAILAGDALQALAFRILSHYGDDLSNDQRIEMIKILTLASGSRGMAGGQAIDLDSVGKQITISELENMHIHKTGALIRASINMGALCATTITPEELNILDHYAKCIGLAFQIKDDILDVESDTQILGKTQGADAAKNKPTYPSLIGMAESKNLTQELLVQSLNSLNQLDLQSTRLEQLAHFIIERNH
ncbi:(2E,6E)-farnesyl diphosphate synthase [hydrothermal vent metagenome]|uniref:(2E,6E)-farnesyl diphosphate synthase n=1 Tax=hydrothermal vent metagenome TaxID=652676 RepID=A0A3B0ZXX6_9ZZZZ